MKWKGKKKDERERRSRSNKVSFFRREEKGIRSSPLLSSFFFSLRLSLFSVFLENGHRRLSPRRRRSARRVHGRRQRSSIDGGGERRGPEQRPRRRQGSIAGDCDDAIIAGAALGRGPRLGRGRGRGRLRLRPGELWQHLLLQQRSAGKREKEEKQRGEEKRGEKMDDEIDLKLFSFFFRSSKSSTPLFPTRSRPSTTAAPSGTASSSTTPPRVVETGTRCWTPWATCSRRRMPPARLPRRGRALPFPLPLLPLLPLLLLRTPPAPSPPPPAASCRACLPAPRGAPAR